jgi:DNA (cytosine-5)-methyltransferase 1
MGKGFGEVVKVPADSGLYQTVGTGSSSGNGLVTSVYSGTEKRKFTIAELKRICAFPDDFILKGTYAQRWERLGRAVPPVMMKAVAETIRDQILARIK